MTGDEMFGWLHRLNGHEFEETQGDGEGQGSLVLDMQKEREFSAFIPVFFLTSVLPPLLQGKKPQILSVLSP